MKESEARVWKRIRSPYLATYTVGHQMAAAPTVGDEAYYRSLWARQSSPQQVFSYEWLTKKLDEIDGEVVP